MAHEKELPIIQKTYDLILWYVPHLNKLPLSERIQSRSVSRGMP